LSLFKLFSYWKPRTRRRSTHIGGCLMLLGVFSRWASLLLVSAATFIFFSQPEACILIDAGTKPATNAIYHLWDAFKQDENVGGCCGELYPMIGEGLVGKKLLNPLVAMQNFEYKVSNMLGESVRLLQRLKQTVATC
jgi:hypothetical protein